MRFLPAGPSALLIELEDPAEVLPLVAEIQRRRESDWQGRVVDVVPGATTVLLDGIDDPAGSAAELSRWVLPRATQVGRALVEIPCRYGGPDLAWVAAHWKVADDDVPAIHSSLHHRVAFCGFSPGFAYITGLGDRWSVPRLATPRPIVPAGSVAVAGIFTGVYPRSSPGGWRIIGHADAVLWDAERDPPALLSPGTPVRFVVA